MIKGQDVIVLLKLHSPMEAASVRDLAEDIGFDVAGTHRSLKRLEAAGLYSRDRRRVLRAPAEEFLLSAVKFTFPAVRGGETRGLPTAWAMSPLKDELAGEDLLPPVWPFATGKARGLALEPVHPTAPKAALKDEVLWIRLALLDGLRSRASTRITNLAEKHLRRDLRA